jgi:hypothetical protein
MKLDFRSRQQAPAKGGAAQRSRPTLVQISLAAEIAGPHIRCMTLADLVSRVMREHYRRRRPLPDLIAVIHREHSYGRDKAEIAQAFGLPIEVVNDAMRGRLPTQVWWDKASPVTVAWLAQHYPTTLA